MNKKLLKNKVFNKIKILFYIILSLNFSTKLSAISYNSPQELGSSARHIALGNVDGASTGADAIFENIAALYRVKTTAINIFSTSILWDVNYNNIAFAKRNKLGVFGIAYYEHIVKNNFYNPKDNPNKDHSRGDVNYYTPIGTFDDKKSIFKIAYQNDHSLLGGIHYGIASSFHHYKSIESKGKGFDFDVSAIKIYPNFILNASIKNIFGSSVKFKNSSYNSSVTTTAKEQLNRQWVLSGKSHLYWIQIFPQLVFEEGNLLPSLGLSYTPGFLSDLTFFTGFKQTLESNQKKQRLSLGLSYTFKNVTFHYAYEKGEVQKFKNQNYMSLEVSL